MMVFTKFVGDNKIKNENILVRDLQGSSLNLSHVWKQGAHLGFKSFIFSKLAIFGRLHGRLLEKVDIYLLL